MGGSGEVVGCAAVRGGDACVRACVFRSRGACPCRGAVGLFCRLTPDGSRGILSSLPLARSLPLCAGVLSNSR